MLHQPLRVTAEAAPPLPGAAAPAYRC
jgi:hypothetical protein